MYVPNDLKFLLGTLERERLFRGPEDKGQTPSGNGGGTS